MLTKLKVDNTERVIYFEVGKEGLYHVTVRNSDGSLIFEKLCWELETDINYTIKSPIYIVDPEIQINPTIPVIDATIEYETNKIFISSKENLELKIRIYDHVSNKIIWRHNHQFDGQRIWFSPNQKITNLKSLILEVKDKWGGLVQRLNITNDRFQVLEIPENEPFESIILDKTTKKFEFSVKEDGIYNLSALNNGQILLTVVDWKLQKSVKYFLSAFYKGQLDSPRLSANEFGRLGDLSSINLKFVHIPKSAGTSIEHFGFFHKLKWGSVDKNYYDQLIVSDESNKNWHTPLTELPDDLYEGYDLFCVVRNPYKRVLSAVFCGFKSSYPKTVEEFNSEIVSGLNSKDNIHYHRQYDFVYKDQKKKVKWVLKFENLKEELEQLINVYGFSVDFNLNSNKSVEKTFSISDIYPETIKLINEKYKLDFEKFGYEMIEK